MLTARAVLFNTTNMNKDTEGIFSKLADDIKLGRVGDMLEILLQQPGEMCWQKRCDIQRQTKA